jgi:hypothetical protein
MANRDSQIAVEVARSNANAKTRLSQIAVEVARSNANAKTRLSQIAVEVLHDRVQASVHGAAEPIWVGGPD